LPDIRLSNREMVRIGGFTWIQDGNSGGIQEGVAMVENTLEIAEEEPAAEPRPQAQWELAECTCPDYCERDHELD
jgi:hypothetical protein